MNPTEDRLKVGYNFSNILLKTRIHQTIRIHFGLTNRLMWNIFFYNFSKNFNIFSIHVPGILNSIYISDKKMGDE